MKCRSLVFLDLNTRRLHTPRGLLFQFPCYQNHRCIATQLIWLCMGRVIELPPSCRLTAHWLQSCLCSLPTAAWLRWANWKVSLGCSTLSLPLQRVCHRLTACKLYLHKANNDNERPSNQQPGRWFCCLGAIKSGPLLCSLDAPGFHPLTATVSLGGCLPLQLPLPACLAALRLEAT